MNCKSGFVKNFDFLLRIELTKQFFKSNNYVLGEHFDMPFRATSGTHQERGEDQRGARSASRHPAAEARSRRAAQPDRHGQWRRRVHSRRAERQRDGKVRVTCLCCA